MVSTRPAVPLRKQALPLGNIMGVARAMAARCANAVIGQFAFRMNAMSL
jgi:hypothetical protein